ncbi:hypothetical protein ACRAWF_42105 [Streptomyces sp. L7]
MANPYNGVTGDDFEFYRSHIDSANNVVYDGPVAEDSTLWAQTRVTSALAAFTAAGLPKPTLWTTPPLRGFGSRLQGVQFETSRRDWNVRCISRGLSVGSRPRCQHLHRAVLPLCGA